MHRFLVLAFLLPLSSAYAAEPPVEAKGTIERVLLTPLAEKDAQRSRFARSAQPPRFRVVRVLDAHKDADGAEFFLYVIDEKHGFGDRAVTTKGFTGCVYPKSQAVFVKRGDAHYPASFLLGKSRDKADAGVCVDG